MTDRQFIAAKTVPGFVSVSYWLQTKLASKSKKVTFADLDTPTAKKRKLKIVPPQSSPQEPSSPSPRLTPSVCTGVSDNSYLYPRKSSCNWKNTIVNKPGQVVDKETV